MERTAKDLTRLGGLALLVLGAALYLGFRDTSAPGARLQSDVDGKLELVVGYVASARRSALRNTDLVTDVVNGLPTDVDVLLATNDPEAFTMRNARPERVRLLALSEDRTFTIWPQDPFLVLEEEGGDRILLASREFERANDAWFARELGAQIDWPVHVSTLSFEGGNVVSDEATIFIGANTIYDNAVALEVSEPDVVKRFERELGRSVLVVGPWPQAVGHIDMMMTPLGGRRVMIADARAGAALARTALVENIAAVQRFEEECESSFFGHPSIRTLVNRAGETIEAPSIRGETERAIEATEDIADALDGVARALEERGYTIERVPFLFGGSPSSVPTKGPGYPTLTYNNVLLEQTRENATVYLPRYGFEALDRSASNVWRGQGFRVEPIEGLAVSAMYGGSLRCCFKVLSRSERAE